MNLSKWQPKMIDALKLHQAAGHSCAGIADRKTAPLDIADAMTDGTVDLPPDSSLFAVTFAQLNEPHCRWPIGDPANLDTLTFCGADKMHEGPYCARHHRLAYRRPHAVSPRFTGSWRAA